MEILPTVIPYGFYESPVVRALIQIIPIAGGPLDTLLAGAVSQIRADRQRTFFEELARGIRELDDDTLRSEPFLHAYFSTLRAAESTRQRDKIRCLARLLSSSTGGAIDYGDDYEEMLGILTETTYLELQTLSRLAALEDRTPHAWFNTHGKETDVARAFRIWPAFLAGFGGWSHHRVGAHLTRLARTGLYEPLYDGGMGDIHVVGRTTETYRGLASAISPTATRANPRLSDFALIDVIFQDQSTLDSSAHLRSDVRGTIGYSGPDFSEDCRLRLALDYPHDDALTPDFYEVMMNHGASRVEFTWTYVERRLGTDKTCRLRIVGLG